MANEDRSPEQKRKEQASRIFVLVDSVYKELEILEKNTEDWSTKECSQEELMMHTVQKQQTISLLRIAADFLEGKKK